MMKKIFEEMVAATKHFNRPDKAYICDFDLNRIWSDQRRISAVLQPDNFSQLDLDIIQEQLILILSTLVYMGATLCLTSFRSRFFDPISGKPRVTDKSFPFEKHQLDFFDPESESALQQHFYDNQFRFKPVVIRVRRRQKAQEIKNINERLPFENRVKSVGSGGYGQVDCVSISPSYIRMADGGSFREVSSYCLAKLELHMDIILIIIF
jgi:hypothetical protein